MLFGPSPASRRDRRDPDAEERAPGTTSSPDETTPPAAGGAIGVPALPDRDVAALGLLALAGALAAAARGGASRPLAFFFGGRGFAHALPAAGAVVVLACLACRIFRSRFAGWAAAGLGGIALAGRGLGDGRAAGATVFLLAGFAFLLLVTADRPSSGCGLGAGVLLGIAGLLDPWTLVLAPLAAAPLFDRRFPGAIRRALAGSVVLGVVLALAAGGVRRAMGGSDSRSEAAASRIGASPVQSRRGESETPALSTRESSPTPASPAALFRISWPCLAIGLAGWGGLRPRRPGVRALAVTALALSFLVPDAASSARGSIRDPLVALYAAAGLARIGKGA